MDARTTLSPGGQIGVDEALIRQIVDAFYARVRQDDLIGPVFERTIHDWPAHLDRLTDFWSSIVLTSGAYKGNPLRAHFGLGDVRDPHFRRWLDLFEATLRDLCTPQQAALFLEKAERIADSFRFGMAMQRGDIAMPLRREA